MITQYKIAIVDDEKEMLEMLKTHLEKNKEYLISTYNNPVFFLDNYTSEKYDLILSDINMPEMFGLDLLEKIKKINKDQKVCIMTAFSSLEKVLVAHKKGACNYIMKPIKLNELDTKTKQILS
jgi:DNA-binding NtrC family response regulator